MTQIILDNNIVRDIDYVGVMDNDTDLIIRSDRSDYYGMGGAIFVYFSIENTSDKPQNIKVLKAYGNDVETLYVDRHDGVKDVQRITQEPPVFNPDTGEETVNEVEKTVSEVTWKRMTLKLKDGIIDPLITPKRKDIKDRKHKHQFTDLIHAGETVQYRACVKYPKEVNNSEFIFEAFGDEHSYGYLDPNLWTYEELFNDMTTDNDLGDESDWTESFPQGTALIKETGTPYEGTKHVQFEGSTGGSARYEHTLATAVVSGTVYVSLKADATTGYLFFHLFGASDYAVFIGLRNTGNIDIYTGSYTTIQSNYSADTYYRIGLQFECGSGAYEGLSADTVKWSIDNGAWSSAFSFKAALTEVTRLQLQPYNPSGIIQWVDTISPDYTPVVPSTFIPKIIMS